MLKIRTYLDRSTIHGIGLFAGEEIEAGGIVWEMNPLVDKIITPRDWELMRSQLSAASFTAVERYSYKEKGCYCICLDNAQFMNHSEELCNIVQDPYADVMYAGTLIKKGEELFCNYFQYSDSDDHHVVFLTSRTCSNDD